MITSNRDCYLPFHTTPDALAAVEAEATKLGLSRSKVVHDMVVLELRRRGHEVAANEFKETPE